MATRQHYPNALEWVQLAARDRSGTVIDLVHVRDNGRIIEATDSYQLHAVKFCQPELTDGLYDFRSEYASLKLADMDYPNLAQYEFQTSGRMNYLPQSAESSLKAFVRAAEVYERGLGLDLGVIRLSIFGQDLYFSARRLRKALAGMLMSPRDLMRLDAEPLLIQTSEQGGTYPLMLYRRFPTQVRRAAVMNVRYDLEQPTEECRQWFDLTPFFKPVSFSFKRKLTF